MTTPNDEHRRRERLRCLIAKHWREQGRRNDWTDAEIEQAIDAAIERENARHSATSRPGRTEHTTPPVQATMFDADEATRRTRQDAAENARPKQSSRRDAIELWVASKGDTGATRDEISIAFSLPIQSVCSPVRDLVRTGRLRNTRHKRPTRQGELATVVVSALLPRESSEGGK
ncbi:hypothetical protein [Novipirellula caenicola]|uniref:hypothetical protein n=1 Tax=Novipirellula caenicola TaxID=1536901 RepID=UPI0031EAA7A7